jgi:hypothetical protein
VGWSGRREGRRCTCGRASMLGRRAATARAGSQKAIAAPDSALIPHAAPLPGPLPPAATPTLNATAATNSASGQASSGMDAPSRWGRCAAARAVRGGHVLAAACCCRPGARCARQCRRLPKPKGAERRHPSTNRTSQPPAERARRASGLRSPRLSQAPACRPAARALQPAAPQRPPRLPTLQSHSILSPPLHPPGRQLSGPAVGAAAEGCRPHALQPPRRRPRGAALQPAGVCMQRGDGGAGGARRRGAACGLGWARTGLVLFFVPRCISSFEGCALVLCCRRALRRPPPAARRPSPVTRHPSPTAMPVRPLHSQVPTTRALSLVSTGDSVMRDMFYNGDVK